MNEIKIVLTTNFGLEAVAKRELYELGYDNLKVEDGRISLMGEMRDIAILNLRLRTVERVFLEIDEFEARSFEELFDSVNKIDWQDYLSEKTNFIVNARSKKSKLFSLRDIQSISEKAIIKKLQKYYPVTIFEKSGERAQLEISIESDIVHVLIDTSGDGLHKRGYRARNYKAPISETIAAALVELSFWNPERILWDPFCGSGTILIEACMIGRNIAPGLSRVFDAEKFIFVDPSLFKEERKRCYSEIDYSRELEIFGTDISRGAIEIAKANAEVLGLEEDIRFFQRDVAELDLAGEYGVIITNPPYGHRIGDEVEDFAKNLGRLYRENPTWSLYAITSDEKFEKNFGKKSNRNRKLYNGNLRTYYYQYHGPRPK